MNRGRNVTGAY